MTSPSPQRAKKPRRRFSSGSQDAPLASLTNREPRRTASEHVPHPLPSAPALGKRTKKVDQKPPLSTQESRQLHIYDRAYFTDGSDIDAEADWRRGLIRRGRSTSDASAISDVPDHFRFPARHHSPPTAYVSLPSTPVLPLKPFDGNDAPAPALTTNLVPPTPVLEPPPPPRHQHMQQDSKSYEPPPFSLWDYLREELLATDFDSHQELKWERVSNFLNIPLAMEKVRPF